MISYVFVIKTVGINMCPIVVGYRIMAVWKVERKVRIIQMNETKQ